MQKTLREQKYRNKPQLDAGLVNANKLIVMAGRGTGKSFLLGDRTRTFAKSMPGALGALLARSYSQLVERTMLPLVKSWRDVGLQENVHFVINKRPKKEWGWPEPVVKPVSYDHCISWCTGTVLQAVSQDRSGMSAGMSFQHDFVDEAKYINEETYRSEFSQARRGERKIFGNNSLYLGTTMVSDAPASVKEAWFLDFAKEYEPNRIVLIKQLQRDIRMFLGYNREVYNEDDWVLHPKKYKVKKLIDSLESIRRYTTHYIESSALDNVDILGPSYFFRQKTDLSDKEFKRTILNHYSKQHEGSFYHSFSDRHLYVNVNYAAYKDIIKSGKSLLLADKMDCVKDGDLSMKEPIHQAMDYGDKINWVVNGQPKGDAFQCISSMWVKKPSRLRDLANKFNQYYQRKKRHCNIIYYYYDHTAKMPNASTEFNYAETWMNELRRKGWDVRAAFIGKTMGHTTRYELMNDAFQGCQGNLPLIRINQDNNLDLIDSLNGTRIHLGKNDEIKKYKQDEKKPDSQRPQEKEPHGSDAFDTLFIGMYVKKGIRNLGNISSYMSDV